MVTAFNIVYNTVANFIFQIESCRWLICCWLPRAAGRYRRNRGNDGRKPSQPRDCPNAEIPPDTDIASARTGRSHHRKAHRGGHSPGAASTAGAPDRARDAVTVPDPSSRRREAGLVRTREKRLGGTHPQSWRVGAWINSARGEGNLRGS